MKDMALLFGDPAFRRLGWALAAFLWQGTLVAAILACVNGLLRRRDPRARYAAGCAALLLMLLLPAVTYLGRGETAAGPTVGTPGASGIEDAPRGRARSVTAGDLPENGGIARAFQAGAAGMAPWIVPAWLCGVMLLSARFLAGWNAARRLPLRGVRPAPSALITVLERLRVRLGVDRRVTLLESVRVSVPTALGVLRPAILLPVCAVTGLTAEAIEAILAHELAHIRRHDYFVNLLQAAAETLLFYHPAVWWVSRRIRIERENCCDDLAVIATGDSRGYVRALVVLEEIRAPRRAAAGPAVAADGASLWRRIARLMPVSSPSPSLAEDAPRWLAGLLALGMVATIGAAARTSFFDSPVTAAVAILPVPPVPPEAATSGAPAAPVAAARAASPPKAPPVLAAVRAVPVSAVTESVEGAIAEGVSGGVEGGVSDGVSGGIAGVVEEDGEKEKTASAPREGVLTPEELANLRRHGVTPEFLRALARLGYREASVNDLVALRIHGVTPEYVSEMTALLGKQSLDELVSLRIHGVTPDFVRRFHEAGYPRISADDAESLRIHGVDPDAAAQWATITGRKPGLDEIVSARIHGATPEYAREMRSLGLDADLDGLVGLRIHGVTPEFVRDLRALAYTKLSADDAVACRIHGVTPDFVREMQSLGYAAPSIDELTDLRIHGATPEFIRKANASAGARLSIDELITRRIHGRNP